MQRSDSFTGNIVFPMGDFRAGSAIHSILKFFQVDRIGMLRMTSVARYFKEGVAQVDPVDAGSWGFFTLHRI